MYEWLLSCWVQHDQAHKGDLGESLVPRNIGSDEARDTNAGEAPIFGGKYVIKRTAQS